MRNLIRNPLTWMVAAELVVVSALILLAWNAIAAAARPVAAAPPVALAAPDASATDSPLPALPSIPAPSTGPRPGLNVDPAFWLSRLQALNQDQVYFEQLEWRLVHTSMDAAQRYLETVVLPSVRQAERARG